MDDFELLMLNDSMKYVSLLISCLEPLFISANWFMDIGHLMWWLESRCSLHKCWFLFNPALTYRYNTNSIDTQFKKVTVVTSCIDTLIWVSILSNLYWYMYLCIDTHEGFGHTEATAKLCIDTPEVSIDTHQQVSIHTHLCRYIHTCVNTFEGFMQSWATAKLCIDTYGLSIDTQQYVSILSNMYRYIWGFCA